MSEAIDIDSDNLCASEDSFEKFQAVSMYEENEYITLSDIISPPPPKPDITKILHEIPNEDVSTLSLVEEPLNKVTSTTGQTKQNNTPKKRGRKKKIDICSSNIQLDSPESGECTAVNDNENSKNDVYLQGLELENSTSTREELPESPDDTTPMQTPLKRSKRGCYTRKAIIKQPFQQKVTKKRGRKPKIIQAPKNESNCDKIDSVNDSNIKSAVPRKTEINKRGRRKKNVSSNLMEFSNEVIEEPETISDLASSVEQDTLPTESVVPEMSNTKKLSELKNTLNLNKVSEVDIVDETLCKQQKSENQLLVRDELTEDEIEDMPLMVLSNKKSKFGKTDTSDIQLGTENDLLEEITAPSVRNDHSFVQKTPRKRGRPKKVHLNNSTHIKSLENVISTTNSTVKGDINELGLNNTEECIQEAVVNMSNPVCFENNGNDDNDASAVNKESIQSDCHNKRNSKKPIMSDFEYNIDSIIKNYHPDDNVAQQFSDHSESKTGESSKRPVRRKAKRDLHYDEGSDEDPYANIELSDDEPHRRKSGRYHSDDEYIPGGKRQLSDLSDSDIDEDLDVEDLLCETSKQNSRKYKRSESGSVTSPRKRAKKGDKSKAINLDVSTQKPTIMEGNGDLEDLLETSIIKTSDDTPKAWGTTKEFKDFLDKISQGTDIKIKKSMDNSKTPLQIPVLDQNKAKKTAEMCAQTDIIKTKTISVQTSNVYEVPMKNQVALTALQSNKACEFLSSIVKTTAELGQLMTQKSEDFIEKKINTTYVTDTIKMDYCVKKSFLLFRLAKHNLVQMEEDLAKQYEEFLKENNLIQHREKQKTIESTSKATNSDSDCEIVEDPVVIDKEVKSVFNPKTVFLNKELSIKIAKKHSEEPKPKENLNIKGRHTVWINDSIMVKKVKPTQSFLAQDSRNKKPPDTYVTLEMVSDFFKVYNQQKALSICAKLVRPEWCNVQQNYSCCYFFDKTPESSVSSIANTEELTTEVAITENNLQNLNDTKFLNKRGPDSLLTLCTKVIRKITFDENIATDKNCYVTENMEPRTNNSHMSPNTCNDGTQNSKQFTCLNTDNKNQLLVNIRHLKTLCYEKLIKLICMPDFSKSNVKNILSVNSKTNNSICEIIDNACIEKPECSSVMEKVKPLFSLCSKILIKDNQEALETFNIIVEKKYIFQPDSLKRIVLKKVILMFSNRICIINNLVKKGNTVIEIGQDNIQTKSELNDGPILDILKPSPVLPLKSLCIDVVNYHISMLKSDSPISLNLLCIHVMNTILDSYNYEKVNVEPHIGSLNFTINNVNTVSEDIFFNNTSEDYDGDDQTEYLYEEEHIFSDEADYDSNIADDDNNWVSQVQMKELRTFVEPTNSTDKEKSGQVLDLLPNNTVNIKIEPIDELSDNNIELLVKSEPQDEEEESFMPLETITKQEIVDDTPTSNESIINSNSYDSNAFEAFVSSNKMIMSLNSYENINDNIFTQSSSRVRRQYEPDSDTEIENFTDSLNLLVPQNIETAKDRLMESSSDEDINKKKKPEKRGRGRPKKSTKTNNAPPIKEIVTSKTELAVLTRKMREKIRQVEKQNESSESELDDTALSVRKCREKIKDRSQKKQSSTNIVTEKEIQCNDVDSTEQIHENDAQYEVKKSRVSDNSVEAATNYDKEQNQYNDEDGQLADMDRSHSPLIDSNEPVELLECEPTIPMFDNFSENTHIKKKPKLKVGHSRPGPACSKKKHIPPYIDHHGWNCYPIDTKDNKIYLHAQILLHKLPESFVQTYLKYQDLSEQSKDDSEVDKLTNLQSLHRNQSKEKGRLKVKDTKNASIEHGKTKSSEVGKELLPDIKVEQCEELMPSEDENENTEDLTAPLVTTQPIADNCLAKDFLMNDDADSDSEKPDGDCKKSEKTPKKHDNSDETTPTPKKTGRPSRTKVEEDKVKPKSENLMLTADKMMTKELAMLHAPVDLKEEIPEVKEIATRSSTRNATKTSPKTHTAKEQRDKDDSSSEEEKQWFTTKEKLLKRLEKKHECPSVDDAKRAKIVSEFIEKRSDGPQIRLRSRPPRRPPRRRSLKKLMERRKQMKILTRELLGDDASHTGKNKSYQTYGKGRRNIRKVINKKALSHSTVVANMEEFERKQRLSLRQTQLREILGCEEGVNVVVINDELCLEYDFEELRPVVTVHPFFTKVMKAHQYEGVKFMWDACFESVSQVQSGHAGSGCILAHCMGLGKTLQVLALLHTVLTHPKVGMQRVLVCCPLSTVLNWVDEIHKWIGPVTAQIKVFELSKLKKTYERAYQLEDWYNGGGIFIIGYELFRSLSTLDPVLDCVRATILNKIRTALLDPGPDIVICDEGHLLKNDCSVLAVAMSRVKTKRRIILTGTPMQNNLREYYCMVNFVKPSLLGSYSEYSNRFENPIMNGQHRDSIEEDIKLMKARTHILHKVLEGCLQRQEASVLYPYLPKKHEYTVFVSLTKSQRELYTHYLTNYAKETKQSVLKDFHVLQKIWTHPQVLHNFFMKSRDDEKEQKIKVEKEDDLVAEDLGASEDTKPSTMETWWLPYVAESEVLDALHSSNKFLVIFRLLDECIALGDKVLIFSTSLYTMDALEYFLRRINNWSLGREYYRLDGSVPAEVRQKWCREFNAESNTGTKLFLISTRAGSLGLNMTAANRVVILDTSWNPAHDIQSIFRVYRFGQKKDCYIYRLVAMGTMEQKIYERSVTKQAVACRVVDEQQIDRHYNMSELTELYRLDEDGAGVAAGLAAGVRDAALLRVAGSDTPCGPLLYAVHEHDSLLRGSGEIGLAEDERAAVWSQFQEEHANKHIQSIALKLPKKETDPQMNPENAQNDANSQSAPGASDTKPKSKRGRKPVASKNMPVQPSTSSQDDFLNPEMEESMIKKIMEILIQHNFHTTNGPKEISELIQNVRKTVANPRRGRFRNIDPMTASIAKVLIQEGAISTPAPDFNTNTHESQYLEPTESEETIVGTPADYNSIYCVDKNQKLNLPPEYSGRKRRSQRKETDSDAIQEQPTIGETHSTETIVGTPVDNSIYFEAPKDDQESLDCDNPERKRKRHRRDSDEEYVPDKQKMKNISTAKPKPNTRKSSEYNLSLDLENNAETITSDLPSVSVTIPDTDELQVTQITKKKVKKDNERKKKSKKSKPNPAELPHIEKEMERQQTEIVKLTDTQTVNVENEPQNASESILLSDEDEFVEDVPIEVPNVMQQDAISNTKSEKIQNNKQDYEPPIPLHKSLLTNKNFIKIVAHTYLTGNPMLDEDAAILAAQYSTLKALKELEATNKDIISGPIYDIAMQVLGRDLLKKLHTASTNKKDSETVQLNNLRNQPEDNNSSNKKKSVIDSEAIPHNEIKKKPGPKGKTIIKRKLETVKIVTVIDDDSPTPSTSSTITKARAASQIVSAPEVVPVEMFQGPSTLRSRFPSQDECILPDDDDDFIVCDSPAITSHSIRKERNSQPTSANHSSTNSDKTTTTCPKVVQIVQKQAVLNPIPLPPPPVVLNHTMSELCSEKTQFSSSASETICLDSDDEATPVEPVLTTTRRALKSTTKLPHSTAITTADSAAVTHVTVPVEQNNRSTTLLDKKKKIILVNTINLKPSKNANTFSNTIRVPSQNVSPAPDETIFITGQQSSSEDVGPISVMKSKCLPGDIIRISKAGKIDILRKTDKPPIIVTTDNSNQSPTIDTSSSKCVEIVPEDTILVDEEPLSHTKTLTNPSKPTTNIINKKTPAYTSKTLNITTTPTFGSTRSKLKPTENTLNAIELTDRTRKPYASSSDNLKSNAPDPLSVLQNVVHIPADKYQTKMAVAESRTLLKSSTVIITKTAEKHTNMARSSSDLAVKRTEAPLKPFDSTNSQNKATKDKVIDLTEAAATGEIPRPSPAKKVVTNIKMSGTSKEILISKAGMLVNAKNKPSTSFDSSTKPNANPKKPVPTSSQKSQANEASKRPSPWQDTIPNKKKKSDGYKLTLADFNIDDLDDIIELE